MKGIGNKIVIMTSGKAAIVLAGLLIAALLIPALPSAVETRPITYDEKRWAFLIGIEDYGAGLRPFRGARKDVALLKSALESHCGVPPDHIIAMTDKASSPKLVPTGANIERAFRYFQAKVHKSDAFIFFFAGHVAGDEKTSHLLPADVRPGRKKGAWRGALDVSRLIASLGRVPGARKVFFVDGWRESPLLSEDAEQDNEMASTFASAFHLQAFREKEGGSAFNASLFACDVGGRSYHHKTEECGIFAWHVARSLAGECADKSGRVRLSALAVHVSSAVPASSQEQWGRKQAPLVDVEGNKEITWVLAHRDGKDLRKSGDLIVTSTPSGAEVFLDSRPQGKTPLTIELIPAGRHALRIEKEHCAPATLDVDVSFEIPTEAAVTLEARKSTLALATDPSGCAVFLDWRFLGTSPLKPREIAAGTHTLRVLSKEKAWVGDVTVASGEATSLSIKPDRPLIEEIPGGRLINHRDGTILVPVPAGGFIAGSGKGRPEESPPRRAQAGDFFIGLEEVTNGRFASYFAATGKRKRLSDLERTVLPAKVDHPAVNVSWSEADSYCRWAGLRLPTELEWEKAARGTDGRAYPWGNTWDGSRCNNWQLHFAERQPREKPQFGGIGTTPVGTFPDGASPYGCLDMAGNAWEWTADFFRLPQGNTGETDVPRGFRVIKGGSWYLSTADDTRCAARYGIDPKGRYFNVGFRAALTAK
jgi:formylglycine-generating enzyme required for sulfatase activity